MKNIPVGELVLIEFEGGHFGLRKKTEDGDLYTEDNDLDDGDLEITGWAHLPEKLLEP